MRWDDTACAQDRLHDHGCNCARPLERDFIFERLGAKLRQPFGIGFIERIAVGVGGRNVIAARQQGFVGGAEIGIAVDRRAADMGAVIPLFQAQEFCPSFFAPELVVLACQTQRGFDGIRTTGREKGTAQPVWFEKLCQFVRQFNRCVIRRPAEC